MCPAIINPNIFGMYDMAPLTALGLPGGANSLSLTAS